MDNNNKRNSYFYQFYTLDVNALHSYILYILTSHFLLTQIICMRSIGRYGRMAAQFPQTTFSTLIVKISVISILEFLFFFYTGFSNLKHYPLSISALFFFFCPVVIRNCI